MDTQSQIKINLLSKLFDWKGFETFVAEIYRSSDEVEVSHDVIEYGKSGAKYQIDVRVIQKSKLHSIKILIECKFWQAKVDRQIINVVAAAIEDLSASKGVIFTTVGYEEGAIHYAKNKNIDIFIIREVQESEWGNPGRHIWFYFQDFNGVIQNINTVRTQFVSTTGNRPEFFELEIPFTKGSETHPDFQLYSFPEIKKGDYLTRILIGIRQQILSNWANHFNYILQPDDRGQTIYVKTPVVVKLDDYPYKHLKHLEGFVKFNEITFDFIQVLTQTKMEFDRGASSDFILMVENFITKQKNFVSKAKEDGTIVLSDPILAEESNRDSSNQRRENGSVIKVTMDYFVNCKIPPDAKIQTTKTITVNVNPPIKPE